MSPSDWDYFVGSEDERYAAIVEAIEILTKHRKLFDKTISQLLRNLTVTDGTSKANLDRYIYLLGKQRPPPEFPRPLTACSPVR
jgi:hypothetical protein